MHSLGYKVVHTACRTSKQRHRYRAIRPILTNIIMILAAGAA